MMTVDETQIQIALGFLDSCTDDRTGFLPSTAPLHNLPEPFTHFSSACEKLTSHYHGREMNCRAWLEEEFADFSPSWETAIRAADQEVLTALMTQTSLLCHAYLCGNAGGDLLSDSTSVPPALDKVWSLVSQRLGVPKVGNFYALIMTNWKIDTVAAGEPYDLRLIIEGDPQVLHKWLAEPLAQNLDSFIGPFLAMEAKGGRLVELFREIFSCILTGNSQAATYHLMVLSAKIASLSNEFYRAYKENKDASKEFIKVLQPTLVLKEEEGASGLQSCTFQVLESFFGLDPKSDFGHTILEARRLMTPERRKLLTVLDQSSQVLRDFVISSHSSRLLEAYNRCLTLMKTWRLLYVKRGGLLSQTERKTPVQTQSPLLESNWVGMEWGLDSLFRFLTEDQRAIMAHSTETLEYKAGEHIIEQGHLFPGLFELRSGSASVMKSVGGTDKVVDTMGVHEVFGEMSLIENLPASASIVADVDLKARKISLETVYELTNRHPDAEGGFYLAIAQLISRRLRKTFLPA